MQHFLLLFYVMLIGHALADYPLQGDFLAQAKNPDTAIGKVFWPWALGAHSLIHAGFVTLATGSVLLGLAEAAAHAVTDLLKCKNRIGLHTDQAVHIACKMLWAALAVRGVA